MILFVIFIKNVQNNIRPGLPAGHLMVKKATVHELVVDPSGNPMVTISESAKISLLKFDIYKADGSTRDKANYFEKVSIDANSSISKIIVGDKEFTDLSVFLTYMKETEW